MSQDAFRDALVQAEERAALQRELDDKELDAQIPTFVVDTRRAKQLKGAARIPHDVANVTKTLWNVVFDDDGPAVAKELGLELLKRIRQ